MDEQKKFLEDLKTSDGQADVLETPIEPETPNEEPKVEPEEVPAEIKNRRHRRLEEKLQAEREANIALNERLKAIAEAKSTSTEGDYLKAVEKIYGTDSPEAIAATEILKGALKAVEESAYTKAISTVREEKVREQEEVKRNEERLETMVDQIEDEFNVSFTPEMEKTFFRALQKVSPKDEEGNIVAYADHFAVWEDLQSKLKKPENKAKELASRSMVQSGQTITTNLEDKTTERALKDLGII